MGFRHYLDEIARLRPAGTPENLVVLPRVDSTNRIARLIVDEYQNEEQAVRPLLVLALEQTGGRGRQGRVWTSPPGKGVYASRVIAVEDASLLQSLPLLVGVGLGRALAPYLPSPCRLKWPNDLVIEEAGQRKKIGGILIEAMAQAGGPSVAVIGFGVNHGHEAGDLPETGTSVHLLGGGVNLEELTWALVQGVERELAHLGDMPYAAAAWRELAIHRPGDPMTCRTAEGEVEGTFEGLDDQGRLVLRNGGGPLRLSSGEVI
ncbi:MAG TPA: biotin--[acetyl-CoA-carboxylase] ligase [Thermoanaerobaculia bacterium]|jgi:BirA family biotin operon repressor/biotin-[acetyl-CoA-carboxylase] ligase|nr:biotin--[acetyl-CoA-carboxylase] ligase [Thermoanaerobaculia bacterium]